MAKGIYIQKGDVIDYTNGGSSKIDYGDVIVLTDRIGVAADAIPAGGLGAVSLSGVFEIPAESTAAFTVGETLYWDNTNGKLTATKASSGAIAAGICVAPKTTAGTVAWCRLG